MTHLSEAGLWAAIIALGVGTYVIRYSFIGLAADRDFPEWAMRLLRYVPVTVMPALAAPMVVWPDATGGETDPARLLAAVTALVVGAVTRNMLGTIAAGMAALYLIQAVL